MTTNPTQVQQESLQNFHLAFYGPSTEERLPRAKLDTEMSPEVTELFRHPHLLAHLVTVLQTTPERVNLNYWFVQGESLNPILDPPDPHMRLVKASEAPCGTIACLAGHIALLHGASPDLVFPHKNTQFTVFLGLRWRFEELAQLIWRATYPTSNFALFTRGITDPVFIFRQYSDVSETALHVDHIVRFLQEALEPPPLRTDDGTD